MAVLQKHLSAATSARREGFFARKTHTTEFAVDSFGFSRCKAFVIAIRRRFGSHSSQLFITAIRHSHSPALRCRHSSQPFAAAFCHMSVTAIRLPKLLPFVLRLIANARLQCLKLLHFAMFRLQQKGLLARRDCSQHERVFYYLLSCAKSMQKSKRADLAGLKTV
jgi:hypothetical protein